MHAHHSAPIRHVRASRLACDDRSGASQTLAGRAFDVWRFRLARGYRYGTHAHDLDGVALAFSGDFRAGLGQRELNLRPGSALVLPQGAEHTERTDAGTDCVIVAPREAGFERLGRAARRLREPGARDGVTSRAALCELQRELTIDDDLTPASVDRLVERMLASALDGRAQRAEQPCAGWLDRAQQLLDRHFTEPHIVGRIAAELRISVEHFVRVYTARNGLSPGRYARHRRLLAGIEHLVKGRSIADAAARAGFADQAHFTRTCRAQLRTTPQRYRRRKRE